MREAQRLEHDWAFWGRPSQHAPAGDWRVWLILAGRGWGKTRTGAELVRLWATSGKFNLVNVIGATADDARDIMVAGESGILAVCPSQERPEYRRAERRLVWPNGVQTFVFTADEPDRLRGKQHEKIWADEVGAWRYSDAWDQAMFGLRLGKNPQAVVTTTPKPVKLVRDLLTAPTTALTKGTTYENRAHLAPAFYSEIITRYEGTRLGRQELNAELLDDTPGALWSRKHVDDLRLAAAPDLTRIVVAVDPAMTSGEDADETGIVVAGKGADGHGYVLADKTCRMSPDGWARRALSALDEFNGDRIVAEVNNGGEMVEHTIRTARRNVAYKAVHASRGKRVRAEPIAALYEQGKVHHVGTFAQLEDQMCSFTPDGYDGSPDRVDALVWALTELFEGGKTRAF